jgi:hypothetical protein
VQETAVLDTAVQAIATQETDVLPELGRHRAAPSPARRAVLAMALGGGGVLLAVVLGWAAAGSLAVPELAAADALPTLGAYEFEQPEPTSRPAPVDRAVEPPTESAIPTTPSVPPTEAPPPAPVATAAPEEPSLPTVQPGDRCATEGDVARTRAGDRAVCVANGNGRTRWRHA